ncbi:MAG TPA: hypothetical protein ENN13_01350 [Candidatus Altiarchaeales archaeon]|nr:hypothetical protein [Candidatus Altiarchaeales archaeon]
MMRKPLGRPLTFEDFLDISRKALEAIPVKEFDEMGRLKIPEYQVLTDQDDRQALKRSIKYIVGEAHNAGVKAVIADGLSGKPAAHFFAWTWEKLYGPENVPRVYGLGDSLVDTPGIVHIETKYEQHGNQRILPLAMGGGVLEVSDRLKHLWSREDGSISPNSLLSFRDKPILIITEFVNRGRTFKAIENVFEKLGFQHLHYAGLVVNDDQYNPRKGENKYLTKTRPWLGANISDEQHQYTPAIPWLHLRSELYNELKKTKDQQDTRLIENHRKTIRQTMTELKKLAQEIE